MCRQEDGKNPEKWATRPFERKTLRLAWAGFIVAISTVVVFYFQFREMQNQTKILRAQANQAAIDSTEAAKKVERQLNISQDQAKSAQASVKAIQRQMRQDQRAWMSMVIGNIQFQKKDATDFEAVSAPISITNTGKTPAKNVVAEVVVKKVKNGDSPTFRYAGIARVTSTAGSMWQNTGQQFQAVLARQIGNTTKTEPRLLSTSEYQELLDGNAYIAVYGRVLYYDVFGIRHWTKVCNFASPATHEVLLTAKKCSDYNGVDNN